MVSFLSAMTNVHIRDLRLLGRWGHASDPEWEIGRWDSIDDYWTDLRSCF